MPVFNEQPRLAKPSGACARFPIDMEIICVDDASSDNTAQYFANLLAAGASIHLFVNEQNRGKGAAREKRTGRRRRGDIAVVQDADLEYDRVSCRV